MVKLIAIAVSFFFINNLYTKKYNMIKKFEEFVNENYNQSHNVEIESQKKVSILFDALGFPPSYINRFGGGSSEYTFEEVANIVDRLNIDTSSKEDAKELSYLFDMKSDVERKQEALNYFEDQRNGGHQIPVIIDDYTGKILTGVVFYCGALDKYTENEDNFSEDGFEYLADYAWSEGYTKDGGIEYAENNWDDLEIEEIDLDKEFGKTEK